MRNGDDDRTKAEPDVAALLRDHAAECGECAAGESIDVAALTTALADDPAATFDFTHLRRTSARLRSELAVLRARRLRRRVASRVAVACIPLPFVAVYARYVLQLLYEPFAAVLAPQVLSVIAGAHVALLALLFGATYAAIPLWMDRMSTRGAAA